MNGLHDPAIAEAILRHVGPSFIDPDDALLHLTDSDVLDERGAVNVKRLRGAVDRLFVSKPHLRRQRGKLTRDQLDRVTRIADGRVTQSAPSQPRRRELLERMRAHVKHSTGIS